MIPSVKRNPGLHVLVIAFCLSLLPEMLNAQFSDTRYFKRNEMAGDLDDLRETILSSHTDPFGFCTRDSFFQAFEYAISSLPDSCVVGTFAQIVAQAMGVMRDSHSCLDYAALLDYQLDAGGFIIPVQVVSDERGVFIEKDRDKILPQGSQLLSINGHSADSLWKIAWNIACVEGDAVTGRRRVADALFPIITGLSIPLGAKATIDVRPFGSIDIYRHTYRTYDARRWKNRQRALARSEEEDIVRLAWPDDDIAVLTVETFAPYQPGKYEKEIRRGFREVLRRNTGTLVIDLRDNGGGSSAWVEYLYSFIDPEGCNTPSNIIGKNSMLARNRARNLQGSFNRLLLRLLYPHNEDIQGFLSVFNSEDGINDTIFFRQPLIQKPSHIFSGPCYLLINGMTASASVDFSNHFRQKNRGKIIGEPCFGPVTGTWGNPAHYELPSTGLYVNISTIRYNYDNSFRYSPEPIAPDYVIPVNPRRLSEGGDAYIDYVIEQVHPSSP